LRVTAGNSPRLSLAALVATKPGQRPRLIYRTHTGRRHRVGRREDFTKADYAGWTPPTSSSAARSCWSGTT
jgi:hypothetical protein